MAGTKTSMFTIDHDRCAPEKWTAHDVLAIESKLIGVINGEHGW